MAHFKTLFLLSLLFAVVLVNSYRASADNEPGVAQTQGGAQVDNHGGGDGRRPIWRRCRYPHCKEGVHGDETHQAETQTKSGETESTNTNESGDGHKPYKPKHCKYWPHCH
ncbi:unnamed protein product [Fraxinus pennsylvanica]|uniref:Uncharacterized protein n=1 Tax=Fraxinus pennsylvanica TaxID=56036 RepID=A0AAD1YVT5_9LAMI|nr:unnamed protein product [Fraxinus pennsylvanica]